MIVSSVNNRRDGFSRGYEPIKKKRVPSTTGEIFQQALDAEILKIQTEDDYKEKEMPPTKATSHSSLKNFLYYNRFLEV